MSVLVLACLDDHHHLLVTSSGFDYNEDEFKFYTINGLWHGSFCDGHISIDGTIDFTKEYIPFKINGYSELPTIFKVWVSDLKAPCDLVYNTIEHYKELLHHEVY